MKRNIIISILIATTLICIYRTSSVNKELNDSNIIISNLTQNNIDENNKILDLQNQLNDKIIELELARRKIELLETKVIVDTNDVTQQSNATITHIQRALKGTDLYDISDTLVIAEETYPNINALFLAAIIAQESGWGKSDRAIYDNNLTGLGVYNSLSRGLNSSNRYENIMITAKLLSEDYLNRNGKYYLGTSVIDVNTNYCFYEDMKTIDYRWSSGVGSIAINLMNKANNF